MIAPSTFPRWDRLGRLHPAGTNARRHQIGRLVMAGVYLAIVGSFALADVPVLALAATVLLAPWGVGSMYRYLELSVGPAPQTFVPVDTSGYEARWVDEPQRPREMLGEPTPHGPRLVSPFTVLDPDYLIVDGSTGVAEDIAEIRERQYQEDSE